jgi:hypothetical protein
MVRLVQNAQFEHCMGTNLKPKVVQSDRTSVLAASIMLHREEVGRPLQRPVQLFLQVRYKMETLLIVLLVVFLLGGGGWGYRRWRG